MANFTTVCPWGYILIDIKIIISKIINNCYYRN